MTINATIRYPTCLDRNQGMDTSHILGIQSESKWQLAASAMMCYTCSQYKSESCSESNFVFPNLTDTKLPELTPYQSGKTDSDSQQLEQTERCDNPEQIKRTPSLTSGRRE